MVKMKDSGNKWLERIPENWTYVRTLYILEMPITDGPHTTPVLYDDGIPFVSAEAVSFGKGKIDFEHIRGFISESFYQECCRKYIPKINDIYMIKSGATTGRVSIVDTDKIFTIWSPLAVFRTNEKKMLHQFLFYSLQSDYFQKQVQDGWSYGTQQNIGMRTLEHLVVCLPPIEAQKRIANFLDEKCVKIDSLKNDIEKQIETLEQYKESIITEVVTKGINPNVKMKDSGIEWIGEVNETAEIIRLKFYSYMKGRIGWQGLKSTDFIDEGPYCVTGTDFINGKVNWDTCYHVSEQRYCMDKNIQIKKGDLLMTKDGTIGKLAIIDELPNKACLNSHLLIIRPLKNKYTNKYLFYVMKSHLFSKYYTIVSSGTTMDSLSQEKTGDFSIPVYEIDAQNKIVEFLDSKCNAIDTLITSKKQQLEKLEEYKKSLIFEYVTGKREV